jgi:hypothetical protein
MAAVDPIWDEPRIHGESKMLVSFAQKLSGRKSGSILETEGVLGAGFLEAETISCTS